MGTKYVGCSEKGYMIDVLLLKGTGSIFSNQLSVYFSKLLNSHKSSFFLTINLINYSTISSDF